MECTALYRGRGGFYLFSAFPAVTPVLVPQIETVYKIVQHLAANDRVIIQGSTPDTMIIISEECVVDDF